MSLVTMNEMLPQARREKRAVGAFNVANYETALAVMKAAEAEKSPVIIQVFDRLFLTEKAADIAGTLLRLARRSNQPIALHLDHGSTLEHVAAALHAGYTSVMLDGSRLPGEGVLLFQEPLRHGDGIGQKGMRPVFILFWWSPVVSAT